MVVEKGFSAKTAMAPDILRTYIYGRKIFNIWYFKMEYAKISWNSKGSDNLKEASIICEFLIGFYLELPIERVVTVFESVL